WSWRSAARKPRTRPPSAAPGGRGPAAPGPPPGAACWPRPLPSGAGTRREGAAGVGVDVRLSDTVEDDLEDRLVEVVAAQPRHAGGGDDLVHAPGHVDQRRVER